MQRFRIKKATAIRGDQNAVSFPIILKRADSHDIMFILLIKH